MNLVTVLSIASLRELHASTNTCPKLLMRSDDDLCSRAVLLAEGCKVFSGNMFSLKGKGSSTSERQALSSVRV